MEFLKSISVLIFLVSVSSAFDITKVEPESITIPYGGKIRLSCTSDGYYEFCKFKNVASGKICDFIWKREPYNVTTNDCGAFEGRARFVGDYNKYECAVELDNVMPEGKKI